MSKKKFNGENNASAYEHVYHFILNCNHYDIDEGVMCKLFTLSLAGIVKHWCKVVPFSSICTWDAFVIIFLHTFYHFETICDELENLRRFEGESLDKFRIRFKLICSQFQFDDLPLEFQLIGWLDKLISFPFTPNPYETISCLNESSSPSINMTEKYVMEKHVNYNETVATIYDRFLHLIHTSYSVNDNSY